MFVWPPIPLQPLDDGLGPEVRPLGQVRLGDDDRARRPCSWLDDERVGRACEPASAHEPAVVGMPGRVDVVLDDDRDPEERSTVAAAAGRVGGARVGEGRRADRDDRVELRVQLRDPVQVELDELDRAEPVPVHQRLELGDRASRRR